MKKNINDPQFRLYEYNTIKGYSFSPNIEESSEFKLFSNDVKMISQVLDYFKNFAGVKDVIRYTNYNGIVSYYTIRNGIAVCGSMKDGEIDWNYMEGMTNFVIPRFKAFKEHGITFETEELNNLFDKKTYTRTRNR